MKRVITALGPTLALLGLTTGLHAEASRDTSVFSITKSENKNYVQYAVRLDAQCAPEGAAPVHAYWRMMERGAEVTEPLLDREQPAYGIEGQQVLSRRPDGGAVQVALRALPHERVVVETYRSARGCEARARTPISGVEALLFNVHAVLAWPFGVSRLIVTGWSLADGRVVRDERHP